MIRKEEEMKLIIYFKHGGRSEVPYESKEELMKHWEHLKKAKFNKDGRFATKNVIIPYNEIQFIEKVDDESKKG